MLSWINRIAAGTALVLATSGVAFAQGAGTVTGSVVDATSGEPLAGVQVHIPALGEGMLTNPQGRYLLPNIPVGTHTIRVQTLGYASSEQSVTVTAGGTASANFRLSQEAISIDGITATALGIERSERSLGYAVQNIDAERLATTPQTNITSALQGKVAGVQVVQSSSRPGASARVTIRGESSFMGAGQPLYVIDGVPVSMDVETQGGYAGQGNGNNPLETGQAGSRSMDIDLSNVEDIAVLRGAAATALYGSRAAHGAIIITTKSGQPGMPTRFSLNTRYETQLPVLEGIQETYTAGREGFYCNGQPNNRGGWCEQAYYDAGFTTPTTNNAWGPHKDSLSAEILAHEGGSVRMVDPRKDFYNNGQLATTSLTATGGIGSGGSFNLGGSYLSNSGITPNTTLDRLNLNANVTLQLTDRLNSNTTVMYANTKNVWLSEGWQSLERDLQYLTPNRDIRQAWNEDGTPVMWNNNQPHPLWNAENEDRQGVTGRWIGSQYFRFDILDNLNLSNRMGLDTYLETRTSNQNERPWRTAEGETSGTTKQERFTRTGITDDLILSLTGTPVTSDFTISGLAGLNVVHREDEYLGGEGRDIVIPGYYNLENFQQQSVNGDLKEMRRLIGLYSQLTVDYRDWAFLTGTARNDWSSTLPLGNNSYFYPSASLGVVFTDALGINNRWLDYGKLRLSVAKVGSDAPPYRLSTNYNSAGGGITYPYNGSLAYTQSNSLGNPDLRPESTTEYEIGTELRLLGGRARVDMSYYDKRSYDQIFPVPSSAATGYTQITRNAGDLRNEGVELSLQTVPLQTAKARLNVNLNWTKNKSSVIELAPGVTQIQLAGYSAPSVQIRAGSPYGIIWGRGFQRNDAGQILIDDDEFLDNGSENLYYGWPLMDDELKVLGETQPDWIGNVYSQLRYGPFQVGGLVSRVQGGQIFNFTLNYTVNRGVHDWTLDRGSSFIYEGVKASNGQPNDIVTVRDEEYYREELGGYLRSENNIEPGTHTRLQEVSLSYDLPSSLLSAVGAGSASIYATGNNLHIWSDFSYVDPSGSNYGSENPGGNYYHMFVAPPMRSYSIGLRANF
ncbi:MAG: SusC/RagA family TonB-linked outer membrane protein [Gemmatimonadota bacterium]